MEKDNQHYIPQGYLRGFTIPDEKSLVWEYDKDTGKVSRQPKSIRKICSEYQYYAQKNKDGSVDKESIENAFHEIENITPRIIRKISVDNSGEKISLTGDEIGALSFFAALLLARVPSFRDGIEGVSRKPVEVLLSQLIERDKREGVLPESIEKLHQEGGINIEIEPFVSLKPMIDVAKHGSASLLEKTWHFVAPANGMSFVTSDNPVYFQAPEKFRVKSPYRIGPFHPGSELTLPLRKDLLLIFSPSIEYSKKERSLLNLTTVCLNKQDTRNINKRTALAARRYVYSSERSEALARMVGKFRGTEQRVTV
jgi:hypothetical protein